MKVVKLNTIVENFLTFLAEEYRYLTRIKLFLVKVPEMIVNGDINQLEFQDFLEKYELETARFIFEKNRFKEEIARELQSPIEEITFKRLAGLGHRGFEDKGLRVLRISNEINLLLLKISVYLKNFSRMQDEFKRLNNFLYQGDYSARGAEPSYNPGGNFYVEA
ncbi:MAG: hypothetical protein GY950_06055 [bacterium]|nr:hypothetical protein [bacterium]